MRPLPTSVIAFLAARELTCVEAYGECLVSTRFLNKDGYRETKYQGRYVSMAHRIVYLAAGFTIPAGLTIDHTCRVRHCLNVEHMEPVTLAENLRRARVVRAEKLRKRGTCANGHPWTPESTYLHDGTKFCRICNCDAQRRHKQRAA